MFESVFGVRGSPAPEDQLGAHQLLQRIVQLLLRHLRDRADQFMRERASERRPDLGYLTGWCQTIKPGKERSVQRRGIASGAVGPVTA